MICNLMLERPLLLTTCNKLICMPCCVGYTYTHTDLQCPCGGAHIVDTNSVIPAPAVIQRMLRDITFPCVNCQQTVSAGMLVKNNNNYIIIFDEPLPAGFEEHTCTTPVPQSPSLEEIMALPLDTPLSKQEDILATTLVKRKLAQGSAQDGILQFRTGGQVLNNTNEDLNNV